MSYKIIFQFLLGFYYTLSLCNTQMEDSVSDFCILKSDLTNKDKPVPVVPDLFSVTLEINVFNIFPEIDSTPTSIVNLIYDKKKNRIALEILSQGNSGEMILNFNTSQEFTIGATDDPLGCSSEHCSVLNCVSEIQSILPQLLMHDSKKIFPGMEIFGQVDGSKMTYMGEYNLDEILVDRWDSCVKQNDTWRNVSVYWTAEKWVTSNDRSSVPILVRVKEDFAVSRSMETRIKPVHYVSSEKQSSELSQPPETVFCMDWPRTISFPNKFSSNAFKFRTEALITKKKVISGSNEWFDLDSGLIRIDYRLSFENNNVVKMIFDYNLGVIYVIDGDFPEQCSLIKPEEFTLGIIDSPSSVNLMSKKLENTADFFEATETDFVYIGERFLRHIDNLVWQGFRTDAVDDANVSAIWEWYFAKSENGLSDVIPTRRSFRVVDVDKLNKDVETVKLNDQIVHNIYGFEYLSSDKIQERNAFDISSCYKLDQIQHLEFRIDVESGNLDLTREPLFHHKWRQILAKIGKVNHLRISQIKTKIANHYVYIQFKIFDIHSDLPDNLKNLDSVSSKQAIFNIRSSIDNGEMFIAWTTKNQQVLTVKAVSKTLNSASFDEICPTLPPTSPSSSIVIPVNPDTTASSSRVEQSSLLSPGTAAGVSCGCFIFGLVTGLGVTYLLQSQIFRYILKR